ncbi:hypothetical protein [Fundicoccus culcitae]|uniref:Uncharacterized protein n=1 Tax=Fundicoccus culcitae TaxID=2969821 RepID=A0ABY5P271_9LACT|nr:hypothetical protein [Fundicoccus culcitae]UUX32802.1 hypothetical protein NRE15_07675 [Fundicoccus culcitae]
MQLAEQIIEITPNQLTDKKFMIERIHVPDNLIGLTIFIEVNQNPINFVLVYDSLYNLRAEYQAIENQRKIVIHQDEAKSGIETKAGNIPAGEWIIAFEFQTSNLTETWACKYRVTGEVNTRVQM